MTTEEAVQGATAVTVTVVVIISTFACFVSGAVMVNIFVSVVVIIVVSHMVIVMYWFFPWPSGPLLPLSPLP